MDTHSYRQDKQEAPSAEPLPHNLTRQVEEEALEQTVASRGVAEERFRRGRIEAESHRISEEVTRQAQERRRQQQEESVAPEHAAGSVESTVHKDGASFQQAPSSLFTGAGTAPSPMPLRRVLVPLGDSPTDKRTLPYAAYLASELQSEICLAYVGTSDAARMPTLSWHTGTEDNQLPTMKKHVFSAYFESLREQIPESFASRISALETSAPSVSEGLLSVESGSNTDLVLVTLRRHTLANHFSLGKVVDTLIQKGSAPVMVVPPRVEAADHPVKVRHILVPLDGSALAEQVLAPLLGWLGQIRHDQDIRLAVTLLGVAENHTVQEHYQSYLEALRRVLAALPDCEHVRVQAEVLVGSSVPEALVDAVEQNIFGQTFRSEPTDLVMMATHGRGGLGLWLFGSIAAYVLPRVHVPVLLVHPAFLDV